jgi:hypothetical protein
MTHPMFLAAAILAATASPTDLATTAQRSGFVKTGRYAEVVALCAAFEKAYPGKARCTTFGTTPEGRPMHAIVASADGVLDPEEAKRRGRPVVVAQGGIHAGEIDGKDAGFWLLPDLLSGKSAPGALSAVTFVFVPVFNVDGHERFGPNHRPNQRGPAEMGWRVTSHNLNLNRDYAKADAPEMQAMLGLLRAWDPVLYVDLHVTDGAKFRHDVAILLDPAEVPGAPLRDVARRTRDELMKKLTARGHLPLDFYPAFERDDDPASGFSVGASPPRLSNPYWGARGRLGMLVETHSWRTYQERVRATRDVLEATLEIATRDAASWAAAVRAGDEAAQRVAGQDVVLAYDNGDEKRTLDFLGYAYARTPSPISGKLRVVYDEKKPAVWRIPLVTSVKPVVVVKAPGAGWLVPPGWADAIGAKLALHGFASTRLDGERALDVDVFRASEVKFGDKPYEGRMTARPKGAWTKERRVLPRGTLYVPVAQAGSRLLVHLMEPEGPDSFAAWGTFNAAYEQKEYMEDYVAEEWAEQLLRKDPAARAAFEKLLEEDPAFAADPKRRLDFFYRRHPSWDERKDLVPVFRVHVPPT